MCRDPLRQFSRRRRFHPRRFPSPSDADLHPGGRGGVWGFGGAAYGVFDCIHACVEVLAHYGAAPVRGWLDGGSAGGKQLTALEQRSLRAELELLGDFSAK